MISKYKNGNTIVTIHEDGTKTREWPDDEIAHPDFPESIDLKITDHCDLGCPFCHEGSTKAGFHCDTDWIYRKFKCLPAGIEVAIGGGNPMSHPGLQDILVTLKSFGLIPNITMNSQHLWDEAKVLQLREWQAKELVYGIGISNPNMIPDNIDILKNIVWHVIAGVDDPFDAMGITDPILVLGYKTFGRGIKHFSQKTQNGINRWKYFIVSMLRKQHISFDNLALKQLNVKNIIPEDKWSQLYMGDDGQFTMYYDAVKNEYAMSSTSNRLFSHMLNIKEMFNILRDKKAIL